MLLGQASLAFRLLDYFLQERKQLKSHIQDIFG
jgi:hypothetical protein